MSSDAVRVVHVATGNAGRIALSQLIEDPRFELVGLVTSSPEKVGKDAGELAGLGVATGVAAVNDLAEALATKPDCVVYCALAETRFFEALEDIKICLAAGANVVATSPVPLMYPWGLLPDGMRLETFDLGTLPLYNGDLEATGFPEPVAAFRSRLAAADALLIATPEYNYSVTGVLKGWPSSLRQPGSSRLMPIGSTTAPDRMCAPTSPPFSRTTTERSGATCFNRIAAARPAGPAPTITTSNSMLSRSTSLIIPRCDSVKTVEIFGWPAIRRP